MVFSFDTGTVPHRCQLFCTVGIDIGKISTAGKECDSIYFIFLFLSLAGFQAGDIGECAGREGQAGPSPGGIHAQVHLQHPGHHLLQDTGLHQPGCQGIILVFYPVPNADVTELGNNFFF